MTISAKPIAVKVAELTRSYRFYSMSVTLLALVFGAYFSLVQSLVLSCSVVESRIRPRLGPIGRELVIGNETAATDLFKEIQKELSLAGIDLNVALISTGRGGFTSDEKGCSPGFFDSRLNYPVVFGGETVAQVVGSARAFPIVPYFFLIFFIVGSIWILSGVLTRRLVTRLDGLILTPIRLLSRGEPPNPSSEAALEVTEIQENFERLKDKLIDNERELASANASVALGELAAAVSHDIRSPLGALKIFASQLEGLPEGMRLLITNAIKRIQDIANTLLEKTGSRETLHSGQQPTCNLLQTLLPLLDEKKYQAERESRGSLRLKVERAAYSAFVHVHEVEFLRAVSNIIDNAFEATSPPDGVSIEVVLIDRWIDITISDSGPGFPDEVIRRLGMRGNTLGKVGGKGLGLALAKEAIESFGGSLELRHATHRGARVVIKLPAREPPAWFLRSLSLRRNDKVLVLDDDPSIYLVWKELLKRAGLAAPQVLSFTSAAEFQSALKSLDLERSVTLIDYELRGQDINGLDLIERLGISKYAKLVTGRFDSREIRDRCSALNVQICAKAGMNWLPISIEK